MVGGVSLTQERSLASPVGARRARADLVYNNVILSFGMVTWWLLSRFADENMKSRTRTLFRYPPSTYPRPRNPPRTGPTFFVNILLLIAIRVGRLILELYDLPLCTEV